VLCVAGIYNSELSLEWQDDSPVLVPAHVDLSDYYVSSMWTNTNKQREFYMARFHTYKQPSKLNCYVRYEEADHRISACDAGKLQRKCDVAFKKNWTHMI
jgi:hypothetical protein